MINEELTFVFNIEPYTWSYPNNLDVVSKDSEKMVLMLCESIRALGITSPIKAISSNGNNPCSNTLDRFIELDVEFDNTVINDKPFNGYFNKIYAFNYFSDKIATPYVCFLDIRDIFNL